MIADSNELEAASSIGIPIIDGNIGADAARKVLGVDVAVSGGGATIVIEAGIAVA